MSLSMFTFDSPVITFHENWNGPTSGAFSVTIIGMGLGSADFTSSAKLGPSLCATTSWNSLTSLSCLVSTPGGGHGLRLIVTTAEYTGTSDRSFSYDGLVLTGQAPPNSPPTAGLSVTLLGSGFDTADHTPSSYVMGATCSTTSWTAATIMMCFLRGHAIPLPASAFIQVLASTGTSAFTFDPIVVTHAHKNLPATGSMAQTLQGLNFAQFDLTLTLMMSMAQCTCSTWVSVTSSRCITPAADLTQSYLISASISPAIGTSLGLFSYDSPVLTETDRNAPTSGMTVVGVGGLNFGAHDYTQTLAIAMLWSQATSGCSSTTWTSDSNIICVVSSGCGKERDIRLYRQSVASGRLIDV
jgi:hypothetical protein